MCTETITRTTITYNRSRKVYQVLTPWGEIINEFPSGHQGKRAAELETIRADDQQAYDEAYRLRYSVFNLYAETHSRIWRAARIVADKAVYSAHPLSPNSGQEAYHVKSQAHPIFYTVTRPDDFYTCTCPDFDEYHAPTIQGQKLCKHILAVKITKALKRPFPAYLDSPRDLWRHLEETGTSYKVLGAWNRRPYLYAQPQYRPAVAGEIVEDAEGNVYRLTHNGQRFGSWKITIPEPAPAPQPESSRPASRYEGVDPILADQLQRKRERMSNHNRQVKELQRQQAERNAVKAYRQRKAAAVEA